MTTLCACGCGTTLSNVRYGAKYATPACRTRAYRRRKQRSVNPSHRRHAARKPDLRISYRRAVDQITALLAEWYDPPLARRTAEANLAELLTDRQRKALT